MIKLQNVSKSFSQFQAIKSISLTINKGEIYGIIGASGAGKSTLLRLINLLEIPDKGEVEVNGQQLTILKSKKLRQARQSMGMIFQHFNLVANKTVYDNVAVSLELAKTPKKERRSRVVECLQFVGLESLMNKYPAELSGGQKQRIAIARALLLDPRILILDDSTSSVDLVTEAEIQKALDELMLGRTSFVIAQRISTVINADQILVLDKGQIVARGNHEELMEESEIYAEIYNSQLIGDADDTELIEPEFIGE